MSETAPEGFQPHTRRSRVTDPWEPIYARETEEGVHLGLRIAEAHCDSRGFLHGGVVAALADNAMGFSYGAAIRRGRPDLSPRALTLSLSVDYVSTGRPGAWLEVLPRVVRAGSSIGFVEARVTADAEVVARASATFKLLSG